MRFMWNLFVLARLLTWFHDYFHDYFQDLYKTYSMDWLSACTSKWNLPLIKRFCLEFFSWRYIFLWEMYLFSNFFFTLNSLFISIVFFRFSLSMFTIFLSWALYYPYKICSKSGSQLPKTVGFICFRENPLKNDDLFFSSEKLFSFWRYLQFCPDFFG